jgi:phosphate transport system protein
MTRQHYLNELESVRQNLVRMGDTTIALLSEAIRTISGSTDSAARASELEAQTDHQHRLIHDQCFSLITLQAPVARDARLITGILDAIVDLELIGDYAYEIVTLSHSIKHRPPLQILNQIAELGTKIRDTLSGAIDVWRGGDGSQALSARPVEASVRAECQTLYEKLSTLLASPVDGTPYATLLIICRHFERILRHAVSVAEQAVAAAPAV